MVQIYKKKVKKDTAEANFSLFSFHFSLFFCTFAPAFRRNRWREVTSCPSMLRWNDTTTLLFYSNNGFN